MKLNLCFFLTDSLLGLPLPLAGAFVAVLGAIIGSFLNVVIHRVPREESIVFPNSRCPACATAIHPLDNLPIISYLILRGRCRHCGIGISARYPAVELLTGLLYAAVFLCHVYLRNEVTPLLAFDLVFVTGLVALVFIDAEHMLLPNVITYPGIVFAVIARLVGPYLAGPQAFDDLGGLMTGLLAGWPMWAAALASAGLGALAGGGSLWLIGWIWEKLRGVEAMGLGDVKMMFMVGAYLGWRLTVVTIFLAVLSGSLAGILLMIRNRERNLQMLLPFGIFLGTGAIIALLVGSRIVAWYVGRFMP
ncbi:MAG: leader peptidase (prepilin peptidase) / N-methyltransferase [Blastocatellia bacterium]|nr:leader peptidase (prepilin peptidase) / N-methyltransferase [Blastocatellia bacterium]